MEYIQSIILGIVQGFTEFLPVSSSGHLSIFCYLLHFEDGGLTFEVLLHLATLVSVCIVYRKELWELIKHPFQKYTALLVVASIPAGIVGLFFNDFFEVIFESIWVPSIALLITATLLFIADKQENGDLRDDDISYKTALLIGVAQMFALVPGISRSGSTIFMGIMLGLRRSTAARFSFIMSIPPILGSVLLEVIDIVKEPASFTFNYAYLLAAVAACVFGVLAIQIVVKLLNNGRFRYFGYYCLIVSLAMITLLLLGI